MRAGPVSRLVRPGREQSCVVLQMIAWHPAPRSRYGFKQKMAASSQNITIGRLAEEAGVNLETIRYYERIGLMPPPPRTAGGHRAYHGTHVRRLAFIRHARDLGFGIEDIRALLRLSEPGHRSCAEVRDIASVHLAAVRDKLTRLMALERVLDETVHRCTGDPVPACPVLDMLGAVS